MNAVDDCRGDEDGRQLTPMNVRERQNNQQALDRLVAQRFLYRRAKKVENWRLLSVTVVAGLLLWGLAAEGESVSRVATLIVVMLWFLDQVVLVQLTGRIRAEAATIQEDFDCFVLDIPWSAHGGVDRPTPDRVNELASKGRKLTTVRKGLEDWYGRDEIPTEALAAQLHCQRVNCRWDGRLRKEWIASVCLALAVLGVIGLVVASLVDVSLLDVVLAIAAALRLVAWLCMEIQGQSVAKDRAGKLHGYLSRTEWRSGQVNLCDVRLAQALIFEHRRSCPTVPDWFYRLRRKAHEAMEPV